MLRNYGFAHIFNEYGHYSLNGFPVIFKQRVVDCFKQDWHSGLDNNSVLLYFKPDFGYAPCLDIGNQSQLESGWVIIMILIIIKTFINESAY